MSCRCSHSWDIKRIYKDYNQYVTQALRKYNNVPQSLPYAVIAWETCGHNVSNMNDPYGGSHGVMQILLKTARAYYPNITVEQLKDIGTNIELGVRLLSELISRYKTTDARIIYAHYNGGGNPPNISYKRGECVKHIAGLFNNYIESQKQIYPQPYEKAGFSTNGLLILLGISTLLGSICLITRRINK